MKCNIIQDISDPRVKSSILLNGIILYPTDNINGLGQGGI